MQVRAPAAFFQSRLTPAKSFANAEAFTTFPGTYRCLFRKPRCAWTHLSCTPPSRCHLPKSSSRTPPASVPLLVLSNISPWRHPPPRALAGSVCGFTLGLANNHLGPFVVAPRLPAGSAQTGHDCLAVHASVSLASLAYYLPIQREGIRQARSQGPGMSGASPRTPLHLGHRLSPMPQRTPSWTTIPVTSSHLFPSEQMAVSLTAFGWRHPRLVTSMS